MRRFLFFFSLLFFVMYWVGCKKCYTCQNTCEKCTYTGSGFVLTQTLCRDSFATVAEYDTAIAKKAAYGYICVPTSPTYSQDFCVNKPGEASYPDYFTQGGKVTCKPM